MAAGGSSRMGQPKQLLRFGDVTMLGRIVAVVEESRLDPVVVVLGAHADEIKAAIEWRRARPVFNPDYKRGSATSLRAGLEAIDPDRGVVVVAGDQPGITAHVIDRLVAAFQEENAWAAVGEYTDGIAHPWVLSHRALEAMPSHEGDKLLWHMLSEDERVVRVGLGVAKPIDVNTPEDYERARAALGLNAG